MITVKELKEDAIIDVKVNKAYYLMLKNTLFFFFQLKSNDPTNREISLKNVMEKPYSELDSYEQAFQTLSRMLAEIETVAKKENLYENKEMLEPTDEGYIAPTQD